MFSPQPSCARVRAYTHMQSHSSHHLEGLSPAQGTSTVQVSSFQLSTAIVQAA